ncbi:MAG: radical SAM protein [Thermodesulfobacteriota bacterium]
MSVAQAFDFLIQWHLTERCNLRCQHCYQDNKKIEEMSFPEIAGVMATAVRMVQEWQEAYDIQFLPSFNVTGGEPFLREDFFAILERMIATGFEIYLLSNGTLITGEIARKLADLGVHGVQVSLEGLERTHDRLRGPGSFAAAVAGIQNLLDAGVSVSLNTTLSRMNAGDFPHLADLALSLGVPRLGFSRLVPSGRGLALLDQALTTPEVKEIYGKIAALKIEGLEIATGDPMASQMHEAPPAGDAGDIALGGCAAGVSGLTLLPDGTVTPCRRLPLPIGNVRRDSLRELWAASPVLEALRDRRRYQGRCGPCPRWAQCRGCRAIAYAWSRAQGSPDFLGPDPQCGLDFEVGPGDGRDSGRFS